jgi:hypothetical protein
MLPRFQPHPLIPGGHAQTIAACYFPGANLRERARRHVVELPDGDRLVLHEDRPDATINGGVSKVVLLVHGLGGSHRSGYMQRCMAKLTARGIGVFRMDLRTCGAGAGLARLPVHAGRSEDVAAAASHIMRMHPQAGLFVIGFSMGANMVLKLAGEWGGCPPPRIAGVMAVAPPIDLVECSKNLRLGMNRLYDQVFVSGLLRAMAQGRWHVPAHLNVAMSPRPRTLAEFDDRFTAPLCGFKGADDYYAQASSGVLLKQISVPALIVTAADDPIVPLGPFERASYAPQTRLAIADGGGHLGFIGRRGCDPDRRWLDWRVVEWVESIEARPLTAAVPEAAAASLARITAPT